MNKLMISFAMLIGFITQSVLATDIADVPIEAQNASKPNLIFAMDNSGSMDSEVLLNTNDGALWWNSSSRSFTDNFGKPLFNSAGTAGGTWYKFVYLFPNGTTAGARIYSDASYDHFAIPPIPAYAFLRSPDYNPLYYNPKIEYQPWEPAYLNNTTKTFNNMNPTAAVSHPAIPASGSSVSINLTANLSSTSGNWTFRMLPGMTIPGATISGVEGRRVGSNLWQPIRNNYTIPNNEQWDVDIPYYPATYYLKDATCASGVGCAVGPDGARLRRYEIKPGNVFPTGRTYTAELQNFANWFSYYRKRRLMLAGTMGDVLSQIKGIRGGIVSFNKLTHVTMHDFNNLADSQNARVILGSVYTNSSDGGTPTRNALNHVGQQYLTNSNIIQNACQINAAMVLTDGYANASGPNVPAYNRAQYGFARPFSPIYQNSLADIALAYYTLNLNPSFPAGLVPVDINDNQPGADKNSNLHMNTYALTLGTKGTLFGTHSPSDKTPFAFPPNWPSPNLDRNPTAVDDLWHATLNGRGLMLDASEPSEVISSIQKLINDVLIRSGSGAAIGVNPVNISTGDDTTYATSYNNNTGELKPLKIDLTTGVVTTDSQGWSAKALLNTRTPANRLIATYNGSRGIPFQWVDLPVDMQLMLNSTIIPPGPADGVNVLNWLRGNRTLEGAVYRSRTYLLGDIVYAEPVIVKKATANYTDSGYAIFKQSIADRTVMIYQGANDGMLHAFTAATGEEAWAYIPHLNFNQLNKLPSKSYSHRFYVDGTPTVSDVDMGNNNWHTLLVGGLRAGGSGYYALDVTDPSAGNEADLASKVKWEFPNTSTPTALKNNIGLSFGKPIIAKTKAAGWVVLVTSGYNNINGDGKGHLFVLNPNTGQLIKELVTSSGSAANPSGLAQISAFAKNREFDATIDYVYGGDLNGNLWRFDLSGASLNDWNVKLLATLVNNSGQTQPITTTPELGLVQNRRIVYVGTGQLLGSSDITNTQTQSMYALVDDGSVNPTITSLRNNLVIRTVTGGTTITGTAVDYSTKRGWIIDFPEAGEQSSTEPVLAFGALLFTTNLPSPVACSAKSFLYMVDLTNGIQMQVKDETVTFPARKTLGNFLTSKPVVVVLPSGKVVALTHNADNTVTNLDLPVDGVAKARKRAWKEVSRQ